MEIGTSYSFPALLLKSQAHPDSKFHKSALIYRGAHFRPNINIIMEKDTFIGSATILVPKLTMKKGSQIAAGTILAGRDEVILEENAVVGYSCMFLTATDTPKNRCMNDSSPEENRCIRHGPIIVEKNAFIGSQACIMPGVTIGENSVVGRGAYVNANVEANKIFIPRQELIIKDREML